MSAPTPVRALVHRRTLVTAGLFIIYSFFYLFIISSMFLYIIFFSLVTIFFSGILAIFEKDLKKLIALRTLSQISFCFFSLCISF
jgi:NADH:ubiquinone oxidoreductase subunit 5 (subunit L)/multisubunit Na+/H+ antiporter MnhA subunit